MAFWNTGDVAPTRKFNFKIQFTGVQKKGEWWHAKSATKPTYDMNVSEYQLINHKFKYPGIVAWQDITITILDTGGKVGDLMKYLESVGYKPPTDASAGLGKPAKNAECIISQLDNAGGVVEKWTLHNSVVKTVAFGDLDYSDDNFVEIQLTIMYDWATIEAAGGGDKKEKQEVPAESGG